MSQKTPPVPVDALLTQALATAGIGVVVTLPCNEGGLIIYCNSAFEAMTGVSSQDILMKPHPFLSDDALSPAEADALKKALGRGVPFRQTVMYQRQDTLPFWCSLAVAPTQQADGASRDVWLHEDILPRVLAEEMWRRWEFVVNTTRDCMAVIDEDQRLVAVNQAFCEVFNLGPNAVPGSSFQQCWSAQAWRRHIGPALAVCLARREARVQTRLRLPRTGSRHCDITFYPYGDQDELEHQAVFILRDITDLKHAEEQALRANVVLEQRVAERTEALEHALKDLEAFTSSVAHDLRAPLRFIRSFTVMIEGEASDTLGAASRRHLEMIRGGAAEMNRMTDGLLAYARTGRQTLHRQLVDLSALATQVADALKAAEPGRQITVRIDPTPACQCDPDLMRQVLANLMGNAFKFTRDQQKPRIRFRCVYQEGRNVYRIEDNGIGLDPEACTDLFGMFRRFHSAPGYEGSGVGLAIVRRIIERHGGQVWIEGSPGKGATACWTLP